MVYRNWFWSFIVKLLNGCKSFYWNYIVNFWCQFLLNLTLFPDKVEKEAVSEAACRMYEIKQSQNPYTDHPLIPTNSQNSVIKFLRIPGHIEIIEQADAVDIAIKSSLNSSSYPSYLLSEQSRIFQLTGKQLTTTYGVVKGNPRTTLINSDWLKDSLTVEFISNRTNRQDEVVIIRLRSIDHTGLTDPCTRTDRRMCQFCPEANLPVVNHLCSCSQS